ncbi:L-cysteine S-thiosulfotransferase [Gammaproteobacteria bacterium]
MELLHVLVPASNNLIQVATYLSFSPLSLGEVLLLSTTTSTKGNFMLGTKNHFSWIVVALAMSGGVLAATTTTNSSAPGKEIAFDRARGNCLACHQIEGGDSPGNIGPALVGIKARYPDKAKLRAQIWDATTANPETSMPPFGGHQMLTDQEIDQVVDFIWSK